MDWSCHSDAIQSAPTSHSTLRTAAWPASPRRSEEALLRSHEGNLEEVLKPPDQLETLASDREAWKDVCEEGSAAFDINYTTRRQKHVALVDTRSQVLQHPVLAVIGWQNLRVRIRAPESSSFPPSACFLASTAYVC